MCPGAKQTPKGLHLSSLLNILYSALLESISTKHLCHSLKLWRRANMLGRRHSETTDVRFDHFSQYFIVESPGQFYAAINTTSTYFSYPNTNNPLSLYQPTNQSTNQPVAIICPIFVAFTHSRIVVFAIQLPQEIISRATWSQSVGKENSGGD